MVKEKIKKNLRDELLKRIFACDYEVTLDFFAMLIANILNVPMNKIKDNLVLLQPDVGINENIVNSKTDYTLQNDRHIFNIEFNNFDTKENMVKNNAYVCHLYLKQIPDSNHYGKLMPITQICINSYDLYGLNEFLYHSKVMEVNANKIRPYTYVDYYDFNLEYLSKLDYNEVKKGTYLEKMLYFFIGEDKEDLDELYEGDGIMARLELKRDEVTGKFEPLFMDYDEEDIMPRELAEKRRKIREQDRKEARAEGLAEGLAEGRAEGLVEGRTEGLIEGRIEIAKAMLLANETIEKIELYTGLSIEEINKITY